MNPEARPAAAPPLVGTDSAREVRDFERIQKRLRPMLRRLLPDPNRHRTVVVIPSLSMDEEVLGRVTGIQHYEERMLCLLLLLRFPRTNLIFVTSQQIHPGIVDYYLNLLPGIPTAHARRRLRLLSCYDTSSTPLTQKILDRPRLLERLKNAIADPSSAHITCFNATHLERTLAVKLNVPLYACDPSLLDLGTKSGSREIFREAGVPLPDGFERLRDEADIVEALCELKGRDPELGKAVVKLEEGTSGEGNATFSFEGCPRGASRREWVRSELARRLSFEAPQEHWEHFIAKFEEMSGIVECFIEGDEKRSPSVQCRIDALGRVQAISTHDQVLGGSTGQVFVGCSFPASEEYRLEIQELGERVGRVLEERGALGRLGVDFVSVKRDHGWEHYALEINLRKGGTTHPFIMLQFLTDGHYDPESGLYRTPAGQPRFYFASDNLRSPLYRRLTPDDLIDIAVENELHFHGATQQGVVFHLIGALSEFGKLGVVCIADSPEAATNLYGETVHILDREAEGPGG